MHQFFETENFRAVAVAVAVLWLSGSRSLHRNSSLTILIDGVRLRAFSPRSFGFVDSTALLYRCFTLYAKSSIQTQCGQGERSTARGY